MRYFEKSTLFLASHTSSSTIEYSDQFGCVNFKQRSMMIHMNINKRIINCCRCHSLFFKNYRILKVIFTLLASFLIGDTFYTLLVRKPTYNSYERRPLSMDDYPEMIVCPEPSTNITALTSINLQSIIIKGYCLPML